MRRIKRANTIEELRSEFDSHEPFTSYQRFMAQALMFLCEQAAQPKRERKPSAWNLFFAKGMKAGKSPAEIATEWKARPPLKKVI